MTLDEWSNYGRVHISNSRYENDAWTASISLDVTNGTYQIEAKGETYGHAINKLLRKLENADIKFI